MPNILETPGMACIPLPGAERERRSSWARAELHPVSEVRDPGPRAPPYLGEAPHTWLQLPRAAHEPGTEEESLAPRDSDTTTNRP